MKTIRNHWVAIFDCLCLNGVLFTHTMSWLWCKHQKSEAWSSGLAVYSARYIKKWRRLWILLFVPVSYYICAICMCFLGMLSIYLDALWNINLPQIYVQKLENINEQLWRIMPKKLPIYSVVLIAVRIWNRARWDSWEVRFNTDIHKAFIASLKHIARLVQEGPQVEKFLNDRHWIFEHFLILFSFPFCRIACCTVVWCQPTQESVKIGLHVSLKEAVLRCR